ncbi:valine--tRNA ligase [Salinarimonas ramus]|uniref:Valine--tRNA ligase n=1 Tax=Salinarimonas ramus TaxID=690164 RepID=A0A917V5Q2_9HYPH|nr:valine--tRNA ligase [Salinarimonas ramus]GGK43684.1 valine--tRNA ligase [Salinarimonas ramus]
MMDKTFDHAAVEGRIAQVWEDAGAFRAGRPERTDAKPYTIMIPPPNVTGSLHMGHALNNTLQDVLCRFERMRGRDVLWQPGMDHAGIATQMVVERKLAADGRPSRREMGREAFLEEVWAWKEESGGAIVNQLKRLGASCDWSRERFTMDEGLSKAVLKVFVELYRQGLLYKDKRLVNWDPKFQTAISDLEVQQVETKGNLWHFRYPIEGEGGRFITVATTRPETMLGDTAVAVHPEDERYADLVGKFAILPLVGRRIPIVADEYSDPEKGTGAVKITPAHDFNDFEVGKRNNLRIVNVFDRSAHVAIAENEDFLVNAAPEPETMALHGLDRFEARKRVVEMMEARELLAEITPNVHAVPHGDRSGVVVEPYLTDQWFVNVKPLAERALGAVKDGRTRFVPENWEKTYFQWLENIEPWCVSRQLWWGHQIPAWYDEEGNVYVAYDEAEAQAQAREKHGHDVALTRDEDVLDTWFSSALWPFSTLGWPDETPEVARYYPTNTLVTGFDIIFFWVARMMMAGLHFMDEVPFDTVYIHALVRDEKGAKMSKSKGNVIDPLSLVDQFGADALRFTLVAMAAQGRDIKLAVSRVEGYRNFSTKIWNAARFAEMNGCVRVAGYDPKAVTQPLNVWALSECARAFADVTEALEAFRFNDAAAAAYRFTWNVFCDWYLELSKPVLQGEDGPAKDETRATAAFLIDQLCKLLHPFMPFITEELWAAKGAEGPARDEPVLALAAWPDHAALLDEAAEAEIGFVVDLISEIRSARSETGVPGSAQVPLVLVSPSAQTKARVEAWSDMIRRLARASEITVAESAPKASAFLVVRGESAALPLQGVVDIAAERARLAKEDGKLAGDEAKSRAKLDNPAFLANAKEEVVEEMRERLDETLARRAKIAEALARLQA